MRCPPREYCENLFGPIAFDRLRPVRTGGNVQASGSYPRYRLRLSSELMKGTNTMDTGLTADSPADSGNDTADHGADGEPFERSDVTAHFHLGPTSGCTTRRGRTATR